METIKVIDLLNKIANGEEVPKTIIYNGHYYYNVGNKEQAYYENTELDDNLFLYAVYNEGHLNDKIEIIEDRCINVCGSLFTKSEYDELAKSNEDKKIEKLDCLNTDYAMERRQYGSLTNEEIVLDIQTLKNYINKLIDKVSGE